MIAIIFAYSISACMKKTSLILSSLCTLALVACGPGRTEQAELDKAAEEAEKAQRPEVQLPPPITESTTYRCRGGSVIYVDYLGEDEAAQIRIDDEVAVPVLLKPSEGSSVLSSEDGSISISRDGKDVNATLPGKGSLSCNS